MKLRVVLTRQPIFDIDNLYFLTEANPRYTNNRHGNAGGNSRDHPKNNKGFNGGGGSGNKGRSKNKKNPNDRGNSGNKGRSNGGRNGGVSYDYPNTRHQNKKIFKSNRNPIVDKTRGSNSNNTLVVSSDTVNNTQDKKSKASNDSNNAVVVVNDKANNTQDKKSKASNDSNNALAVVNDKANNTQDKKSEESSNKFINMMNRLGNSIAGVFRWIMDQLRNLPALASRILEPLKSLWRKIKGWCTRFHILDRARSLSMLTVACVGFVATIILSFICGVPVEGINRNSHQISYYIKRLKDPEQYISNSKSTQDQEPTTQEPETEMAVFIEAFGEILREDSNGGIFMAMAKKAIEKGKKIADDVCIACRNFKNKRLTNLVNTLRTFVYGSSATLEDGSTIVADNTMPSRFRRRLYNETAFDDSLSALYESIIWEAQAHKIKSMRKKAIKKVKSKRFLKGWV